MESNEIFLTQVSNFTCSLEKEIAIYAGLLGTKNKNHHKVVHKKPVKFEERSSTLETKIVNLDSRLCFREATSRLETLTSIVFQWLNNTSLPSEDDYETWCNVFGSEFFKTVRLVPQTLHRDELYQIVIKESLVSTFSAVLLLKETVSSK